MDKPLRLFQVLCCIILLIGCNEDTITPVSYGSIEGLVVDADGEPLNNVAITTSPASSAIVSDEDGGFILENLPIGDYAVTARKTGYSSETINVAVRENAVTPVQIFLTEREEASSEIGEEALQNRFFFARNVDGNFQVVSSDSTGENQFTLTSEGRNWQPRLSPNRQQIAFISDRGVQPQIYLMDKDGSNQRRVTNLPVVGFQNAGQGFSWSPDGGRLLYAHYDKLLSIRIDGSDLIEIATAPESLNFKEVHWSPATGQIVAQTVGTSPQNANLVIMNGNGSNMQDLLSEIRQDSLGVISGPHFSVDGRSVVFSHDASKFVSPTGRQLDARIVSYNMESGTLVDLSDNKPEGMNDMAARFSPTGAHVIFSSAPNDGEGPDGIFIMDLEGNGREQLFANGIMPEWF